MSKTTNSKAAPAGGAKKLPPKNTKPAVEQSRLSESWINSCFQETLLPNAPWHKLEDEVSHNLAQKAEKQFSHPQRKEMLLEVLGNHFVDKYLSHIQRNPVILEPVHMSPEERKRLKIDAQNWLTSQMYKAVKETGHGYLLTGIRPGEPPPTGAYAEFLQHTFRIFTVGLDRELYKQEQLLLKAKFDELNHMNQASNKPDIYHTPAPSRIKPVGTASSGSSAIPTKPSTSQLKSMIQTVEGDPPPLWGTHSDTIGSAVATILQYDPRKLEVVVGRMHGRQLPGSLRSYVWADMLFKVERKKMQDVSVEKVVRERFALAVSRGLTELRIKKPTQSPINGLIQNAVIETYSKVTSMVPYKLMEHMKESIRTLNVLYVYDRSYEPYLIHWLFPLQLAFRNKQAMKDDKGEHVLELAMYLDMLNSNCFPSWPHVFAMAEGVIVRLQQEDVELHDHLKKIAPINAQVNPKEFLVQLLHQEREKGELLMKTGTTPRAPSSSTQFLADPTLFLRRWIGEGFVSVLDTPGVMYVWDLLFMQGWQESAVINVCLALMELLRHQFMEAHDYITMREVFMLEPCKLYTVDFQMAWIHAENGKKVVDIGNLFNRQRPQSPVSRMSSLSGRSSPPAGLLNPCGVKNMRASISIPAETIQNEPWLSNLKAQNIRLNLGIYFGSIKMRSRVSSNLPIFTSVTKDSYGGIAVEVEFPEERHIYDMLDLSLYDVEKELGAYPYAIFKLESLKGMSRDTTPVPLGWARIPLYRQVSRQGEQVLVVIEGDTTVSLHPGSVPDSFISTQPQTPPTEESQKGSLIGYNCVLSAHVFDPNNEPADRRLQPLQSPVPFTPVVPPTNTEAPPPSARSAAPKDPTPVPPPLTQREPQSTPPAPPPPPPPESTDDADVDPWIAFKPAATKSDPKPTTNNEPFMLYIDGVRFIPDNASIIKVTGRILRAGNVSNLQDILALPDLDGPARSPTFNFSMLVNEGRQKADVELLLFLRVYTVDVVTEKLVVVGSCLVRVFTPAKKKGDGLLRVGGHQLRLHSGMPDMRAGLSMISSTDLDNNPIIPGCSLLIRLLPATQDPIAAPKYNSGYFKSDESKPTTSESRIFASYADNMNYPNVKRDMIKRLQQAERAVNQTSTNAQLLIWLQNRLDLKKQITGSAPAGNLSLMRCVRYRIKTGLKVNVKAAFGLPDELYTQCFVQVMPGKQAKFISPTDEGHGRLEKFITKRLVPTSHMTAPQWEDGPKELHPFYDANSCLVIRLVGLKVLYRPKADHKSAGTLHKPDGSALEVTEEEVTGWTVTPLFDGNSVISGTHTLPIFTCPLTPEVLEELEENTPSSVLSKRIWGVHNKMAGASIQIDVWDNHFEVQEVPDMSIHTSMCELVGETRHAEVRNTAPTSATLQDFVLSMLEEKARKQGMKGTIFKKEIHFFDQAMQRNFENLMSDYVLNLGLAPLD